MSESSKSSRLSGVAAWVMLLSLIASSAVIAQPAAEVIVEEDEGPNTGNVSLGIGVDFTTAYYFRGIIQENQGFIVQPWAEVGFNIMEDESDEAIIQGVSLSAGIWNSFHDGPSTTGAPGTAPEDWYESDLYFGVGIALPAGFEAGITYTFYTSPNDSFATVHEIAFSLGYDDSGCWEGLGLEGFALNPSMTIAVETQNSAFGPDEGVYLELGIEPEFSPFEGGPLEKLTLSVPVTVGMSLGGNYYELITVDPDDDTLFDSDNDAFGYVSAGLVASMPLEVIPSEFGAWSVSAGVTFLFLGDNLEAANSGDDFEIIGTIGVGMEY